jgi:hypothetical protein
MSVVDRILRGERSQFAFKRFGPLVLGTQKFGESGNCVRGTESIS